MLEERFDLQGDKVPDASLLAFDQAKRWLTRKHPFYGSFLLSLEIVWDAQCPSVGATDGKKVYLHPTRCEALKAKEWRFLLVHEIMHVAHLHMFRKKKRDNMVWNIACDYTINELIIEDGAFSAIEGGLINTEWPGESPEFIYKEIMKNAKTTPTTGHGPMGPGRDGDPGQDQQPGGQGGTGQGSGQPQDGNTPGTGCSDTGSGVTSRQLKVDWTHGDLMVDPATLDDAEEAMIKTKVKQMTFEAAMYAKAMGKDNALAQRVLKDQAPKRSWQLQMHDFINTALEKDNFSWAKPNKRYIDQGAYIPSLVGTAKPRLIGIGVDVSGSISDEMLKLFEEELSGILSEHTKLRFDTYLVDTKIVKHTEISAQDIPVDLGAMAGGGTSFRPAFEDIETKGTPLSGFIYFTDLECSDYPPEPAFPVIWINFGRHSDVKDQYRYPPFGEVVNMMESQC